METTINHKWIGIGLGGKKIVDDVFQNYGKPNPQETYSGAGKFIEKHLDFLKNLGVKDKKTEESTHQDIVMTLEDGIFVRKDGGLYEE